MAKDTFKNNNNKKKKKNLYSFKQSTLKNNYVNFSKLPKHVLYGKLCDYGSDRKV